VQDEKLIDRSVSGGEGVNDGGSSGVAKQPVTGKRKKKKKKKPKVGALQL